MLPEKTFDIGELTLNYAEGPDNGPPLVLLHGLTSDWHAWLPIIPHLMDKWHVYAIDLRGHGKSGRVENAYLLDDYAKDIAIFLRDHLSEPAVVIGHSLGAATALATAARVPHLIRKLIALDPPLYARNAHYSVAKGSSEYFNWVYQVLTTAKSYEEVVAQAEAAGMKEHGPTLAQVSPETVVVVLQNRFYERLDLAADLQKIASPTLLMYGDWNQGAVMRDEDVELVRQNLHNVTLVQIPNGTHQFPWEQHDLTMQHIQDFLATN